MICFLKLGGSLITDKNKPHTAREEVIRAIAKEIRAAREESELQLVLGHGSGSFGHVPAKKYGTRQGVHSAEDWAGFAEVHAEAMELNHIVMRILREEGLPCLSFVPMNEIRSEGGKVCAWDTSSVLTALEQKLIPVVFGDTIFDTILGGTIYSTEDIFVHLCGILPEAPRILLAGLEKGVWADYPHNTRLIDRIGSNETSDQSFLQGSEFTDVTGGMREKVRLMKELTAAGQAASACVFSGMEPGSIQRALCGENPGTEIIP